MCVAAKRFWIIEDQTLHRQKWKLIHNYDFSTNICLLKIHSPTLFFPAIPQNSFLTHNKNDILK